MDLKKRVDSCENHVYLYLPYNQFCRTQNYINMALKGTEWLDRCKEFENLQLKQFMMDILADDTEYQNTPSIFEN